VILYLVYMMSKSLLL